MGLEPEACACPPGTSPPAGAPSADSNALHTNSDRFIRSAWAALSTRPTSSGAIATDTESFVISKQLSY